MVPAVLSEVRPRFDALQRSSALTRTFYRMYRPGLAAMTPEEVIPILNAANVKFVVMGTHGVGAWKEEPRSTDDVDFLITKRDHAKAIKVVQQAFPTLEIRDLPAVTRFYDPEKKFVVIDLMKPIAAVYQAVFRNTVPAGRTYRIPDLEMSLVTKFAAMIAPERTSKKKHLDAADFTDIVQENYDMIDQAKLRRLAEKIDSGCGVKIMEYLEDARSGRPLKLY